MAFPQYNSLKKTEGSISQETSRLFLFVFPQKGRNVYLSNFGEHDSMLRGEVQHRIRLMKVLFVCQSSEHETSGNGTNKTMNITHRCGAKRVTASD